MSGISWDLSNDIVAYAVQQLWRRLLDKKNTGLDGEQNFKHRDRKWFVVGSDL